MARLQLHRLAQRSLLRPLALAAVKGQRIPCCYSRPCITESYNRWDMRLRRVGKKVPQAFDLGHSVKIWLFCKVDNFGNVPVWKFAFRYRPGFCFISGKDLSKFRSCQIHQCDFVNVQLKTPDSSSWYHYTNDLFQLFQIGRFQAQQFDDTPRIAPIRWLSCHYVHFTFRPRGKV